MGEVLLDDCSYSIVKMCGWQLKSAYSLLLFLLLFVYQVHCDCDLTEQELSECIGVITLNGQLLRTSKIKRGEILNVYPIDGQEPRRNFVCRDEGSVKFSPKFPSVHKRNRCARNVLLVTNDLGYNTICHGNIYSVGYNIEGTFLELYRTCYDKENYIGRYAESYIYPKDGASANRPSCGFSIDAVMSRYVESSISRGEVKNTFQTLYQSKYSIGASNSNDNLDRGHLSAANDYLTYAQKSATFKMLNVFPQFHRYQAPGGNWYAIERYIQTLAKLKLNNSSNVLVPAYLHYNKTEDKWKFPVPAWVYKLVKDNLNKPIFASITYNSPFGTQIPAAPDFCTPIECSGYNLRMRSELPLGITYCCNPNEFVPVFSQPSDVSSLGLGINEPNDFIPPRAAKKRGSGEQGPSIKRQHTI